MQDLLRRHSLVDQANNRRNRSAQPPYVGSPFHLPRSYGDASDLIALPMDSASNPVLHLEVRNTAKLSNVVSDKGRFQRERVNRDEKVHRANRRTLLAKL